MVLVPWLQSAASLLAWLGAYWWLAALALALYVVGRRRSVREGLILAALGWLFLKVLGWALVLLVPCIGPNADSVLGFLFVVGLAYLLPVRRWQRYALAAVAVLLAATQSLSMGCFVPWWLWLVLGLGAAMAMASWVLGGTARARRVYQRAMLRLDRQAALLARIPLTPELRAALRARLCQRLALVSVRLAPLDSDGAHASTPVIIHGRSKEGVEQHYFAKVMSQRNWRTSLTARLLRWLQHHGRTEREPILLSLKAEVEYEHYMMLLFASLGIPAPRAVALFRLRPEVYALVSEYLEGARPLRAMGEVPMEYAARALEALRRMRRAGCAHCDIKASNLMVLPGWGFALVDLATARNNAGKRRLAVDLADMLAALALHSEPRLVVHSAREALGQEALEGALRHLHRPLLNTETQKLMPPTLTAELRALISAGATEP